MTVAWGMVVIGRWLVTASQGFESAGGEVRAISLGAAEAGACEREIDALAEDRYTSTPTVDAALRRP